MRTIPSPIKGFLNMPGGQFVFGRAVTTTGGTLSTATQKGQWGQSPLVITKVAATAGRYKILLPNPFMTFLFGHVMILGPADAVWGANTTGYDSFFRAQNIDSVDGTTVDGSILLQFTQTSYADAELPDGASFRVMLAVSDGS